MASTPYSNIALPKEVTDPLYTSSQSGLNDIGTKLLSGTPLPGAYADLGQPNSPAFQAMINSVKGQIMQGSQEASAINGTGRSGVAVTASNNALNSVVPALTYQDFLNSQQQQGALLSAGLSTETGVRGAAQSQQQFDTNFNQTLFSDQVNLASSMDAYKKQAAQAQGSFYGNLGTALFGSDVGSLVSGGMNSSNGVSSNSNYSNSSGLAGNSLSQLFSSLGSMNSQAPSSLTSQLGAFGSNGASSYAGSAGIDSILANNPGSLLFAAA